MSDRFKLRAWDGMHMYYSSVSDLVDEVLTVGDGGSMFALSEFNHRKPEWLMQCTGLNDCNGVLIFEGDIVSFTYWWFDGNVAETQLTGTIVYSADLMSFQLKGIKNKEWEQHTGYVNDREYLSPFSELTFDQADFSVLGNIYEHPALADTDDMMAEADDAGKGTFHGDFYGGKARPTAAERTGE